MFFFPFFRIRRGKKNLHSRKKYIHKSATSVREKDEQLGQYTTRDEKEKKNVIFFFFFFFFVSFSKRMRPEPPAQRSPTCEQRAPEQYAAAQNSRRAGAVIHLFVGSPSPLSLSKSPSPLSQFLSSSFTIITRLVCIPFISGLFPLPPQYKNPTCSNRRRRRRKRGIKRVLCRHKTHHSHAYHPELVPVLPL